MASELENDSDDELTSNFELARFPCQLALPDADVQLGKDAAYAIRQEHRSSTNWKRLNCQKTSVVAERERGTVWILQLESSVEFDWTWEGAVAFAPRSLDDAHSISHLSADEIVVDDEISWKGEVLEVDERNGTLFICLDHPEMIPNIGPFFVRPFEYLSVLDSLFNSEAYAAIRQALPPRLAATQGNIHPLTLPWMPYGLPELREWWRYSWSSLWGPPGTGKTWTTGRQIAAILADPSERILVVSTTNLATDAVAISLGQAARMCADHDLQQQRLLRIGKGASIKSFAQAALGNMLHGTESETLLEIDQLAGRLSTLDSSEEKALTRKQIGDLRSQLTDQSQRNFVDAQVRVVVATAFKAISYLQDAQVQRIVEQGEAPFTTLFIDEAGLMSRVSVAALSLLAARRVVLVGDSKQLSPISRMSRLLPSRQQTWLASSGLSHLTDIERTPPAVVALTKQHRMHPDVCRLVSDYQYNGQLLTASKTKQRASNLCKLLTDHSRTIWYVLDEESSELANVRAERGPGNTSWIRSITASILARLFADPAFKKAHGLFISPFKAQAQAIASLLNQWQADDWESSTVHRQQGSEADIVIFDTVNASSSTWPYDEWKRLINVAISRAREAVIVLASRSEMEEPYLRPLLRHLVPSRLIDTPSAIQLEEVTQKTKTSTTVHQRVRQSRSTYQSPSSKKVAVDPNSLGGQILKRQKMTPVLSKEQQRLVALPLDGKPRLVRGVAGSGKSLVLCHWLARTVHRSQSKEPNRIWAVYANRSLHRLLSESVESAWRGLWKDSLFEPPEFPWESVALLHIKDVLAGILPSASLSIHDFEFDYDRAAEEFLSREDARDLLPRCSAIFIDEAQDMGPSTLQLLLAMVEPGVATDPNSRAAHIFYDNAQNIYGRKTPTWSKFQLDVRGRSSILRDGFRSTRGITELAFNVLHRLMPKEQQQVEAELFESGLIETTHRQGEPWLRVHFSQVEGPRPILRVLDNRQQELELVAGHLQQLISVERVSPSDICVIYNGKSTAQWLQLALAPKLAEMQVEISVQTNRAYERRENTLVLTTANSFKGYESEVVLIPCVDQFIGSDGAILSRSLYVAMTRARSLLALYGTGHGSVPSRHLMQVLTRCFELFE